MAGLKAQTSSAEISAYRDQHFKVNYQFWLL